MDAEQAAPSPAELVGAEVQRRRIELGIDQIDLARQASVDPKTVRGLERGNSWPRDSSRAKIEKALAWQPGSLDRLAAGEVIEPSPTHSQSEPTSVVPIETSEIAAQLVLALDEVFARLHSTVLSDSVRAHLPPETELFLSRLNHAGQLAETLAVAVSGSADELARLKREERSRLRAIRWAPPTAQQVRDLEAEFDEESGN
ncbi:helix-turn-helix domain-containing protein [Nocardia aurea]|uniref:helix-turn-helix domain-containing protein n=1 Tax=Nocardia aurea TaxID=2144174 RepID=UPI0033B8A1DE